LAEATIPQYVVSTAPEKFLPLERISIFRRFWANYSAAILTISAMVVVGVLWEIEARYLQLVPTYMIPPMSKILSKLWTDTINGVIPEQLVWSLKNYLIGYAIGAGIAIPLGLAMGTFRFLNKLLSPYVWILYVLPRIALLPIAIIALGFGPEAKIIFIAMACFFQVIIPTVAGVVTVPASLLKVGRLFGGSRVQVYRKVVLPYALNFIITGLRLAARTGLMVMYSTELFGSVRGIATYSIKESNLFHSDGVFAGLIVVTILAVSLVSAIDFLDEKLRPWKSEVSF
jgi:NitT/TauT family transport system permease protein